MHLALALTILALVLLYYYTETMPYHTQTILQPTNATTQANASNRVLFIVPTWTQQNGLSAMNWNAVTEVDVFHVTFNAQGELAYDGGSISTTQQIITTASKNGAKIALGIGGSSQNATIISTVLSSNTLSQALISNVISQAQSWGYEGIQVDFEGCFNSTGFPSFIQGLYDAGKAINSRFFIAISVADWEQAGHSCSKDDFNVPALAPYVKYFDVMFNESPSGLANWTSQVGGNASKIAAEYNLASADSTYYVPTLSNLEADRSSGYSIVFYSAQFAPASLYSTIIQAGYGNNSTTSTSTTTAPSTIPSIFTSAKIASKPYSNTS